MNGWMDEAWDLISRLRGVGSFLMGWGMNEIHCNNSSGNCLFLHRLGLIRPRTL